jgi:uncharacterized damage-inducible protein DinB
VISLQRIQHLYAYHRWRVQRMSQVLHDASEETLHTSVQGSFDTLPKLVGHLVAAEQLWMERIRRARDGQEPQRGKLTSFEGATAQDLGAAWCACAEDWLDLLLTLNEEDLSKDYAYFNIAGERYQSRLSDILLHVQNHATYHTGQLAMAYRAMGLTPPSTDYIAYVRLPA